MYACTSKDIHTIHPNHSIRNFFFHIAPKYFQKSFGRAVIAAVF